MVLEKTLESPLDCKEIQPVHYEGDQPWDFFGRNDAKAEAPVLWIPHVKSWLFGKDWCWERLGAGGEGDDPGWYGWMASRTRWTWVWVNSERWWWTGKPGVLLFIGSQRVGHDWVTERTNLSYILELSNQKDLLVVVQAFSCVWLFWPMDYSTPGFWTASRSLCFSIILSFSFLISKICLLLKSLACNHH